MQNLIFSTAGLTPAEYVQKYSQLAPELSWSTVKNWADLCRLLNIDTTPWHGMPRRSIDRTADIINGKAKKVKTTNNATNNNITNNMTTLPTPNQTNTVIQSAPNNVDSVASAMADALKSLMFSAPIDENRVLALIKAEIATIQMPTKTLEIVVNNQPAKKIAGLVHEQFENILIHVSIRDHVMLVGPAGSGKTTVCEQVSEALSLAFYCKSVCAQTSKAELLGYMDANGNYITTEFRKAYETGGVFVLDEIDAGNPNVIAVLNSALANGVCAFADCMVKKHSDFVLITCANTFGLGADRQYVGRNQLDAATLDRFSIIEFGYDENLEIQLSGNESWAKCVQEIRKELSNERVVISPRATIQGAKLLAAGMPIEYVVKARITKGMPQPLQARVEKIIEKYYK